MHREYRIHPAIGIARLGDSQKIDGQDKPHQDAYFIGPEAPGIVPLDSGPYRDGEDGKGRIKRQGARFRIYEYAYDEADWAVKSVREITSGVDGVEITWTVHLANKKAAAKTFSSTGQVPEAQRTRNPGVDASELVIDTERRSVSGQNQFLSLSGQFRGKAVKLGDLLTDEVGRLIVLGGHGKSFSVPDNLPMENFADNPGWCDDTSDGPVEATIHFADGEEITVHDSAWVIVAPPDYAPAIPSVVTLYDVAYDVATAIDPMLNVGAHTTVSFTRDIYPILARAVYLQWVSSDARRSHSGNRRGNFLEAERLALLADNRKPARGKRQEVFERLRDPLNPNDTGPDGIMDMPRLNRGLDPIHPNLGMRIESSLAGYQYNLMKRWRDGMFISDWQGNPPQPMPLDDLEEHERPQALDRAALEACVGSPFYPGIEAGYVMALRDTYGDKPFRIAQNKTAGDLTAGNAVPWQADFVECGFNWWPAQRPVSVYRSSSSGPTDWVPPSVVGVEPRQQHRWMVDHWADLGFIVREDDRFVEKDRQI